MPDGEGDPEPAEPAAAGVGVAVTVTEMVTGEQDGQVGHADEPASPAAGTTGLETLGEPVVPASAGTGTTGTEGAMTATGELDGEGVAMTGGPTK